MSDTSKFVRAVIVSAGNGHYRQQAAISVRWVQAFDSLFKDPLEIKWAARQGHILDAKYILYLTYSAP
jgi:hypothetical protein